ncbi:glycosyltransferase [Candidatus Clostridium radicumherbarum]|uniref:Glycosyltransferase n=1 Tax=Candidatus Clostridium radicumherbarum TaxID=3381662 RepID=A0ABW8TU00_9CLOT
MKKIVTLLLAAFLFMVSALPLNVNAAENVSIGKPCLSQKAVDFKQEQRKLWSDHVFWTRNYIISDLANLEDKGKVLERLLRNQDDIGALYKPYYGEENSKKLTALLKEHIQLAGQVVDAAKASNKADLDKYNKLWYENADKIASFLSSANPNWSKPVLQEMLYKHLQLTAAEAVSRLNKNWDADIAAFDKGYTHILNFADVLSDGVVKQFPDKFK